MSKSIIASFLFVTGAAALAGCATPAATSSSGATTPSLAEALVATHIEVFDDLDFRVFTQQKWAELHKSHSPDIAVHWPDGHVTHGINQHITDLSAMFVWGPDIRIKEHPVKFGQGEWTAVIGVMEGTFTKPMPIGDGKEIPPTGKAFKIQMATIGHWKDGTMDEEYLFWDNQEFMRQLGLGK